MTDPILQVSPPVEQVCFSFLFFFQWQRHGGGGMGGICS